MSRVIPRDRVSLVVALEQASRLLATGEVSYCVVAAVDSLVQQEAVDGFLADERLITEMNPNGFFVGEAGSAILVTREDLAPHDRLVILGAGLGAEPATVSSDKPLRAVGLIEAIGTALTESGLLLDQLHYRITDLNGEHYRFKEMVLATLRYERKPKPKLLILWHPIEYIGDVGAAIGPIVLGVALDASRKRYGVGPRVRVPLEMTMENGRRSSWSIELGPTDEQRVREWSRDLRKEGRQQVNLRNAGRMPFPPSPPAGPIPIPYPNTATSDDTDSGSKAVKISGDEVGLKNSSSYKSSKGDEAATKSLGMGVVSHNIQGKMKHAAWSMDVKIEGQNAIRHMDLTTHNHVNNTNGAVVLNTGGQNIKIAKGYDCEELKDKTKEQVDKKTGDLRPSAHDPENGMTATTAWYTPPSGGGAYFMKAASTQGRVKSGKRGGYAKSRKGKQKMACTKKSWGGCQMANHTEPKLIEQVFDAAKKAGAKMGGAADR